MKPTKIIIHHSGTADGPEASTPAIRKWHIEHNGWTDIGYNCLIEKLGISPEILMGRPWDIPGAHTIGQNSTSLGLCFVGDYNLIAPEEEKLIVGAKLIKFWMHLYDIPIENIFPHCFFNDTDCPGNKFDMDRLLALIL